MKHSYEVHATKRMMTDGKISSEEFCRGLQIIKDHGVVAMTPMFLAKEVKSAAKRLLSEEFREIGV